MLYINIFIGNHFVVFIGGATFALCDNCGKLQETSDRLVVLFSRKSNMPYMFEDRIYCLSK